MKNLIITAIISIMLLGAAWAKYESGSLDASSSVLYGTYNGSIVPLKVDSDGAVYPNMTSMTSDITTSGDISGGTITAGGAGGVSRIDFTTNNTYLESLGIGGIYLGDSDVTSFTRLDVDGFIYADKNVGIGTTSTLANLDVEGTVYFGAGNVGIGALPSSTKLAIKSSGVGTNPLTITSGDNQNLFIITERASTGEGELKLYDAANTLTVSFSTRSSVGSYIGAGNFGIGSSTPRAKLDVEGTVYIAETGIAGAGSAMVVCRCSTGQLGHVTAGTVTSPTCTCP